MTDLHAQAIETVAVCGAVFALACTAAPHLRARSALARVRSKGTGLPTVGHMAPPHRLTPGNGDEVAIGGAAGVPVFMLFVDGEPLSRICLEDLARLKGIGRLPPLAVMCVTLDRLAVASLQEGTGDLAWVAASAMPLDYGIRSAPVALALDADGVVLVSTLVGRRLDLLSALHAADRALAVGRRPTAAWYDGNAGTPATPSGSPRARGRVEYPRV